MPSTINRGYSIPPTGGSVDVWGSNDLNPNFGAIDTNFGGIISIPTTGGVITLNPVQLAYGTISVSGALSNNAIVTFPAVQGWWSIENLCTNIEAFTLFVACGTATTLIGIPPGEIVDVQVNGNVPKYRNLGRVGSYLDDCGAVVPLWISGSTIPPYLNCNGGTFSGTTYPVLAARLGGTTLPDYRGRGPFYLNQGTGRLTAAGAGIDGDTRFASGGFNGVNLAVNQVPAGVLSSNPSVTLAANVNTVNWVAGNAADSTPINVGGSGSGLAVSVNNSPTVAKQASQGSAIGSVSVSSTNPSQQIVKSTTPGAVSGIRMIRAG